MKIAIGCDHGGFILKQGILDLLKNKNIEFVDFGAYSTESVDYPIFAQKVAQSVSTGDCDSGILLCGTGIGISIAANKVSGIRASVCHNEFTAVACKEHNNANVLCLGGRILSPNEAVKLVELWLNTKFAEGRHLTRINMISDIENKKSIE